jgi:hypothetical protein
LSQELPPYSVDALIRCGARNITTFIEDEQYPRNISIKMDLPLRMTPAGAPALRQVLVDRLRENKIEAVPMADLVALVKCEVSQAGRMSLRFSMDIVDSLGRHLFDDIVQGTVDKEDDLARYFGLTARPGGADEFAVKAIAAPQFAVHDGESILRSHVDSKLGFEILVNSSAKPILAKNGYAYALLQPGEEYEIRLINESDQDVLAYVTVDGLSVFYFSASRVDAGPRKGQPKYRFYVVGPHERPATTVRGWEMNDDETTRTTTFESFRVTAPKFSAAAKLGREDQTGVISVQFYECKVQRNDDRIVTQPRDWITAEAETRLSKKADRTGKEHVVRWIAPVNRSVTENGTRLGTGWGREISGFTREVKVWLGPLLDVVSVYYEKPRLESPPH